MPPTCDPRVVNRPTVTIIRAAKLAGVSRRTIYNWLAKGKLEYCHTAGGNVRIFLDTLFIEGQPIGTEAHPRS